MPERALPQEVVRQMLEAIRRIERRSAGIESPAEFLQDDEGLDKLDAISMMLIALGESCKHLDRITGGVLLTQYPEIDWKGVMGIRDIMSHHYFDIDAEIVYSVCATHIAPLRVTLERILQALEW